MSWLPIADYALLSDCRSAALVSRAGSVDWLCAPRFDGPSVFARLLDDAAGHWSIRAAGQAEVTRRYAEQTMVLETTLRTSSGTAVLVDALAIGRHDRSHDIGAGPPGVLLRQVTCARGEVDLTLEYAPRPEYGLIHPLLIPVRGGVAARGGADVLALSSPVPLEVDGPTATARFRLGAGQSAGFALHHAKRWEAPPRLWSQAEIARRLDDTLKGWAAARAEIRAAILERGWSDRVGAFTQAFGSDELDASSLMLAIVGFLPGDDPRMKATIDQIAERLTDEHGLVFRYRSADGLEGEEGPFLLCTFWLAQAQALAGEVDRARQTFERAIGYASDVGLLAEEVDPASGELIGNYPQAFSHIGLVNAAWAIAEATSPRRVGNHARRLLPAELSRLTVILPALNEAACGARKS